VLGGGRLRSIWGLPLERYCDPDSQRLAVRATVEFQRAARVEQEHGGYDWFVGSKGTHLTTELQVNQLTPALASNNPFGPGGLAAGQPITTAVCNSYTGTNFTLGPFGTLWDNTNPDFVNLEAACFGTPGKNFPDPNSLRTYAPGLGQIFSLQNVADSDYNAMQVTLRRATGPLTLGIA